MDIQFLYFKNEQDDSLIFKKEVLENILLEEGVKDKPVIFISAVGAMRLGKSYLLNYILRWLEAQGEENWMGDETKELSGFHWKSSQERQTVGLHLWSKAFPVKLSSGKEVVVVLMDTQGLFDDDTTPTQNGIIFSLAALPSSVVLLNLSRYLLTSDSDYIRCFADYANYDNENTIFQHLEFVIRDWVHANETPYGRDGGKVYLETKRNGTKNLHQLFREISCFLMPHPGIEFVTSPNNGSWGNCFKDFQEQIPKFVVPLFASDNIRSINGREVTCGDLFQLICKSVENFQNGKRPSLHSFADTYLVIFIDGLRQDLLAQFINDMEQFTYYAKCDLQSFNEYADDLKYKTMAKFNEKLPAQDNVLILKAFKEFIKDINREASDFQSKYEAILSVRRELTEKKVDAISKVSDVINSLKTLINSLDDLKKNTKKINVSTIATKSANLAAGIGSAALTVVCLPAGIASGLITAGSSMLVSSSLSAYNRKLLKKIADHECLASAEIQKLVEFIMDIVKETVEMDFTQSKWSFYSSIIRACNYFLNDPELDQTINNISETTTMTGLPTLLRCSAKVAAVRPVTRAVGHTIAKLGPAAAPGFGKVAQTFFRCSRLASTTLLVLGPVLDTADLISTVVRSLPVADKIDEKIVAIEELYSNACVCKKELEYIDDP